MLSPDISASVRYSLAVVDAATGETLRTVPAKKNLILDQGLNNVASFAWADLFSRAVVGTGTTPVRRDSGGTTLTRSGVSVSASANFFEAGDVGRLLKFDSGEESYIVAFTDAQNVTVALGGAVAPVAGTVWYVNVVGHGAEVKRSNTYASASGDNGTTRPDNTTWEFKRTFLFSAETGSIVYNEIGWSHTSTAGANLFGRDLITGGIALAAGQQLKASVTLTVAVTSTTGAYASVIAGWTQPGQQGLESLGTGSFALHWVQTNGQVAFDSGFGVSNSVFDAHVPKKITLSTDTVALSAITQAQIVPTGVVGGKNTVAATYITGSFSRTFTAMFQISEGNSTGIRSILVSVGNGSGGDWKVFRIVLDAAETKDSDHTLSFTIRLTWSRVLTN